MKKFISIVLSVLFLTNGNIAPVSALAPRNQTATFADIAYEISLGGVVNKVLARHGIDNIHALMRKWSCVTQDLGEELPDSAKFKIGIFEDCVYVIRKGFLVRYTTDRNIMDPLYVSALEKYKDDSKVKIFEDMVKLSGKDLFVQAFIITPDIDRHIRLVSGFLPGNLLEIGISPAEQPESGLDFEKVKEEGALVFDVDGTLLTDKRTLDSEPELLDTLLKLLGNGFRIAIISGNSRSEQVRRIIEPIKQGLIKRGILEKMENFLMYVNGGATKIIFNKNGNEVLDEKYNRDKGVDKDSLKIVKNVIQRMLKDRFGLNSEVLEEWTEWFSKRDDFPNIDFDLSWTNGKDIKVPVVSSDYITKVMKGESPPIKLNSVWIETRDGAQLAIKLLPKLPKDVRTDVIREIQNELEKQGRQNQLILRAPGFASIDINRSGVDKRTAIMDLISYWGIKNTNRIGYFGDEFSDSGNDMPVLQIDGLNIFSAIPDRSRMSPETNKRTIWIGPGPSATKRFLKENLEDLELRKALSILGLESGEDLTAVLWGEDGKKSRFRMSIEKFMGVSDLTQDQRIPGKISEAEDRAKRALQKAAVKLAVFGKPLSGISQEEFNSVLGISQIVTAGGLAKRYHPFLNKALGHMEITGDTNMRLAIQGSYKSPGVHPVITIGNSLILWLLKDEIIEEFVSSGENIEPFMINKLKEAGIDPVVRNGVIQKGTVIPDSIIDPDKKALFFTSDAAILYHRHFGYGDAFAESITLLQELGKLEQTRYKQYVFSEMAETILPDRSNASFIAYLTAVAEDNLITIGVKEALPKTQAKDILTKKGNLFFVKGRLVAQTDAADMPNYRRIKLKNAITRLAEWEKLEDEEKRKLKEEFAVTEDGHILISANCGVFRNDIIDYFREFYCYDGTGNKLGFLKIDIADNGQEIESYQMDPKTGAPMYVAPDLIETVSRRWQRNGWNIMDLPVGYVNAWKAPTSIKNPEKQAEFNGKFSDYTENILGRKGGVFLGACADRKLGELEYFDGMYVSPHDLDLFKKRKTILQKQLFYTAVMASRNYRALLKVFSGNRKKLMKNTAACSNYMQIPPAQVILGEIGLESYYTLGLNRIEKKKQRDPPRLVALTGGTAIGAFLKKAIEKAGFSAKGNETLLASLLPTLDDGGSTYKIMVNLDKGGYGVLPPIGDQANVLLAGLAGIDRTRYILGENGRIKEDILDELAEDGMEITLENIIIRLLKKTYMDESLPKTPDLLYFAVNILSASRIIDTNYIKTGVLELKKASIRNLFVLALLHEYGLLAGGKALGSPAVNALSESTAYNNALSKLGEVVGVKDGTVSPVSFEPATMYARYEDFVLICKGEKSMRQVILIRPTANGIRVKIVKYEGTGKGVEKFISLGNTAVFKIGENELKIKNISNNPYIQVNGEEWALEETDEGAVLVNKRRKEDKYLLAVDGSGRMRKPEETKFHPLTIGGIELCLRPRLVVMQTNVAETANFSKIVEVGLLSEFSKGKPDPKKKLTVNPEAVRLIQETKDMIIVGPGSIFTSVLSHFMVPEIVNALKKARANGKRIVWIMNCTLDNETAGMTVSDIIGFVEKVSGANLEDIFTDIIFTTFDNKAKDPKLRRILYEKPVIQIREPGAASYEAKKSRGPLVPSGAETENLKKRGICVHEDFLLEVKEVVDRPTGKKSYRILQDAKKVAKILRNIHRQIVYSHEIEEEWKILSFDRINKKLKAMVKFYWKEELLGELYVDVDPVAASINTCYIKYFRSENRILKEMMARAFTGAYYISGYLGWDTERACTYFTLSNNEERESEYWSDGRWQWELDNNPKAVLLEKLGFKKGDDLIREHLDKGCYCYSIRQMPLRELVTKAEASWFLWFYKNYIVSNLGKKFWAKTRRVMESKAREAFNVLIVNANETALNVVKESDKQTNVKLSASTLPWAGCPEDEFLAWAGEIVDCGLSMWHVVTRDGKFAQGVVSGRNFVQLLSQNTSLPIELHMMVKNPDIKLVKDYVSAGLKRGRDGVVIHFEAFDNEAKLLSFVGEVKNLGLKVNLAINPETAVDSIVPYLYKLDRVTVVGVKPSDSGQQFPKGCLDKIRTLRELIANRDLILQIEANGGINKFNSKEIIEAGACILVLDSVLAETKKPAETIWKLKGGYLVFQGLHKMFTKMDTVRFNLLSRQFGIDGKSEEAEKFRRILPKLIELKRGLDRRFIQTDYPNHCYTISQRTADLLKKEGYDVRLVHRENLDFSMELMDLMPLKHRYVEVSICGVTYIIDLAADQFEIQGIDHETGGQTYYDLGVVLIPKKWAEENKKRFFMYATGEASIIDTSCMHKIVFNENGEVLEGPPEAGNILRELRDIYGIGIFAETREITVKDVNIDTLERELLMEILRMIEPDHLIRESLVGIMRQRRMGQEPNYEDALKAVERRFGAALDLYEGLLRAKIGAAKKAETALFRAIKTYKGGIRIGGFYGLPERIREAVIILKKVINYKLKIEDTEDRNKTRYIVLDKKYMTKEGRGILDDSIRILESYKTEDGKGQLFKVVFKMPVGVDRKNIIRLVNPKDLGKLEEREDSLYLPMPYMRGTLFLAAEIVLKGGSLDKLNPFACTIIKEFYAQLLKRDITDEDIVNLFSKPWFILPEIRKIMKDLDKLQTAADLLEKAA